MRSNDCECEMNLSSLNDLEIWLQSHSHSPSLAFQHSPPNSAIIGYASKVSLAGAATSICHDKCFVMTNMCLLQLTRVCHDKTRRLS